jgi:hypothetical protein
MLKILKSIFAGAAPQEGDLPAALVAAATEKIIDGTDPRLRLIPGYKKKLREAVTCSLSYAQETVLGFGSPLELSRRAFGDDLQVRAFFGSVDGIATVFKASPQVRDFMRRVEHKTIDYVFAGMRMEKREKQTLAPALRGDRVEMDVLRTAVNFSNKVIVLPAASEAMLYQELKERIFMTLVEQSLRRLTSIKVKKRDLEQQRTLLRRKLKHLEARGLGMEPFTGAAPKDEEDLGSIERRLEETESELRDTAASIQTLEDYLVQINEVMSRPDEHVRIRHGSTWMTPMGFKVTPDVPEDGNEIFYAEIEVGQMANFVGRLVKFPRREISQIERSPHSRGPGD